MPRSTLSSRAPLENKSRVDEAVPHYRRALTLAAKGQSLQLRTVMRESRRHLNAILISKGQSEEARSDWAEALEARPPDHDAWYGYAEFCLSLGKEEEYRRIRRIMLEQFGGSSEPMIAERTSRACLLLPPAPDELRLSVALADRALGAEKSVDPLIYRHFLFLRGLAEYRQGRFDAALATMRGPASGASLGPAPRLIEAMALNQLGQRAEAKKMLVGAIQSYDWTRERALEQDRWICHVLRRETEATILANPSAISGGK